MAPESPLTAAADAPGDPLHHFWTEVAGAGRAAEGLRHDWQEQLAFVQQHIGYRYLRFHGLFHDDMFVYAESGGRVEPYFQYVDQLFDRLLDLGVKPFVELGFMPSALAREKGTVFWWNANGAPPLDYAKWGDLVAQTVQHWIDRYGPDEVLTWYFEVWNEANLDPFFRGTRSEYFELYRVTALAVKGVDARLRVGGPATSNFVPDARFAGETEDVSQHAVVVAAEDLDALDWRPVWLEEFFAYCVEHSAPVDFVSCHPYPTDWALDEHDQGLKLTRGVDATPTDLRTVRAIVDASAFAAAEVHLTEWSSSSSPRDFTHDYLQAATFVVRSNLRSIGLVDSLAYWVFTDIFEESGAGLEPFHGGFGMLTQHGITKPTFHAYRMLAALGDRLLAAGDDGVLTRDSASGLVAGLFFHYPIEVTLSVPSSFDTRDVADRTAAQGSPKPVAVRVTDLPAGARFTLEVLDSRHGDAMTAWTNLGRPKNLSREQESALRAAALATTTVEAGADGAGVLALTVVLEPWSIALLSQTQAGQ